MTTDTQQPLPEALQSLGIAPDDVDQVREYLQIRSRLGASIRSCLAGSAIALAANACMYAFSDAPAPGAVVDAISAMTLRAMPWISAVVVLFAVGMFLTLYRTILALDATMRIRLGLSERAAGRFAVIARFATWHAAVGERIATRVVFRVGSTE